MNYLLMHLRNLLSLSYANVYVLLQLRAYRHTQTIHPPNPHPCTNRCSGSVCNRNFSDFKCHTAKGVAPGYSDRGYLTESFEGGRLEVRVAIEISQQPV